MNEHVYFRNERGRGGTTATCSRRVWFRHSLRLHWLGRREGRIRVCKSSCEIQFQTSLPINELVQPLVYDTIMIPVRHWLLWIKTLLDHNQETPVHVEVKLLWISHVEIYQTISLTTIIYTKACCEYVFNRTLCYVHLPLQWTEWETLWVDLKKMGEYHSWIQWVKPCQYTALTCMVVSVDNPP